MPPIAIVLHGTTSAGKTSIARALQESATTPTFHVPMDAFACMSTRRHMRSDAERDEAFRLHCKCFRAAIRELVDSQFDLVLDLVLRDEAEFEACLASLSPRQVFVIGIYAPIEVLEERESLRNDRATGMAREQVGHSAYERAYAMRVNTSAASPQEAANRIRQFLSKNAA